MVKVPRSFDQCLDLESRQALLRQTAYRRRRHTGQHDCPGGQDVAVMVGRPGASRVQKRAGGGQFGSSVGVLTVGSSVAVDVGVGRVPVGVGVRVAVGRGVGARSTNGA